MRVQAGRAFDNINKKPDVKGEVLSEGAPHAPGRRYRKPPPSWLAALHFSCSLRARLPFVESAVVVM